MSGGRGATAGPDRGRDGRTMEQLAELLGDTASGDEFPEGLVSDAELEELLSLADTLREVPSARPSAPFRTALRERLIAEATEQTAPDATTHPSLLEQLRERVDLVRRSVSLAAASAACAVLIGAVGIVAAAQHAQPDDLLYGLKQMSESARVGLVGDEVEAGRLHLELAERRLGEVVTGARELPTSTLVDTLDAMDHHTELGSDLLLDDFHLRGETAVLSDLIAFVERQRTGIEGVVDTLPTGAVPFAQRSLDLLDRVENEASHLLFQGCVPCGEGTLGPVGSGHDAARCCADPAPGLPGDREPAADADDRRTEVGIDDEEAVPTPGSRLRGIIPVDPDTDLTDDLRDTVDDVTDDLNDTVDDVTDDLNDTVDDLTDGVDDTLEDLTDLLGD